ncbi:hypothetical protein B0T09DRAFT_364494 [Sordaria sp. MPI-SDFR-AT-0083]|nr:hypothetical protein B0T09DRAFT_364494 [Sordaria sp. MPI-SDFR-AT-0083]
MSTSVQASVAASVVNSSVQASLINASLPGPLPLIISGQDFFSPFGAYGTFLSGGAVAFAFDHLGSRLAPAYKDRKAYKIEIIWTLNPGINELMWRTDVNFRDSIWNSLTTMNTRIEIPTSKFRLLFAEGDALSLVGLEAIPRIHEQTVIALLPFGIPAPHLLDTFALPAQVTQAGVYFDCKVDVTHLPTGVVLLKDHSLASGFNGVRVISTNAPDAQALIDTVRHDPLYLSFIDTAMQRSNEQQEEWEMSQAAGLSNT